MGRKSKKPVNSTIFGKQSIYRVKKSAEYGILGQSEADLAWCFEIPCKKGRKIAGRKAHIYSHGEGTLAYCGVGNRLRETLMQVEGVRAHQTGDEEFSVIFPVSAMKAVSAIVQPSMKRRDSRAALQNGAIEGFSGSNSNASLEPRISFESPTV